MADLTEIREEIEKIDKQMAALFEQRMKCSKGVAEYKKERGLPIYDKEREAKLLEKNSSLIGNKEIEDYYREYLKSVMDISKHYQYRLMEGMRVAYSGIEGSFAAISVSKIFPDAERVSYKSFEAAYQAVENGECDLAVLPIENSYAGEVGQVSDLMFKGSLHINGVYELGVSQCLLGVKGSTSETIKKVISHPQALEQCGAYIHDHEIQTVNADNTAVAARDVAEMGDITVGAIASAETADLYGLKVLEKGINGSANNTTRFAVFSKSMDVIKGNDKSFILMFTVANGAGTLARAITVLGEYGYSMRVIRSRPLKDKNWNYYFYAEVEGRITSEKANKMLTALKNECDILKVIGTYKPDARI